MLTLAGGLAEQDAPAPFIKVSPAKRKETSWGFPFIGNVQHGRHLEQFSLRMEQRWGNWEPSPFILSK